MKRDSSLSDHAFGRLLMSVADSHH